MKGVMKSTKTKSSMMKSASTKNISSSQNIRYPPLKQSKSPEDDYISSLQKQVYYLELEMKLMKDRELETKNKVGGYEVLFRDGVPLNEHFLALKTKYTNEKEHFETIINNYNNTISKTDKENKLLQSQIEQTNKSYYDIIEQISTSTALNQSKLFDVNGKLFNETNTITSFTSDKEINEKDLNKFTSENVQHNRTIEKNNLFKVSNEEKNAKIQQYNKEKFAEINKLTERSILEYDSLEQKLLTNSRLKQLEKENEDLISTLNRFQRDFHLAQAKISELENAHTLNKKYLYEEELLRNVHLKENIKLTNDLDNLSTLNEDKMKEKVKESIEQQKLIIRNQVANGEIRMGKLLEMFKTEEETARDLLEEKNALSTKITMIKEDNSNQLEVETNAKQEIIDVKTTINHLNVIIEDNTSLLEGLSKENVEVKAMNEKYEKDIKDLRIKIDEIQQKIELNAMLNDIDVNELKMLTQNNAMVNSSINHLMTKWDVVHARLEEIENKEKKNN